MKRFYLKFHALFIASLSHLYFLSGSSRIKRIQKPEIKNTEIALADCSNGATGFDSATDWLQSPLAAHTRSSSL